MVPMSEPTTVLDDAEKACRLEALQDLLEVVRPAVQADGGDLEVLGVDVETGVISVQLTGACGSCAVSSMTLDDGLKRILMDRLPWVTEVRGSVDESVPYEESAALGRGAFVPRGA